MHMHTHMRMPRCADDETESGGRPLSAGGVPAAWCECVSEGATLVFAKGQARAILETGGRSVASRVSEVGAGGVIVSGWGSANHHANGAGGAAGKRRGTREGGSDACEVASVLCLSDD